MNKATAPSVETTKDFILIKIPRNLMMGSFSDKKISDLERGLQESIAEVFSGKLIGPFRGGGAFLGALKNSTK